MVITSNKLLFDAVIKPRCNPIDPKKEIMQFDIILYWNKIVKYVSVFERNEIVIIKIQHLLFIHHINMFFRAYLVLIDPCLHKPKSTST